MWALGLTMTADAFGLEARTVITRLGLTSLALAFALKDILSNIVSGSLILRPFHLGHPIVVGDTEGSVIRIAGARDGFSMRINEHSAVHGASC